MFTCDIFTDLEKAFDTVDHNILFLFLEALLVTGSTLTLLTVTNQL